MYNLKRNTHNAHRVIHKYTGYTLKTGINVRKISKLQKYWYNKREQCEQVNNLWITGELITIWRTKRHENHHFSCRKLKKYWKQAIAEYEKRLGPYTKIDIIEVPDEKAPENMSDKEIEQVKEKEGQRILAKIKPQSTVITLEIQGKMLSSEGLAQELNQRMT